MSLLVRQHLLNVLWEHCGVAENSILSEKPGKSIITTKLCYPHNSIVQSIPPRVVPLTERL